MMMLVSCCCVAMVCLANRASWQSLGHTLARKLRPQGARWTAASSQEEIAETHSAQDPCSCTYDRLRDGAHRFEWRSRDPVGVNISSARRRYEIDAPHCVMRRYEDVREARRCLQDRHVVLIGDSVMRYTYLNLANYLENGSWVGGYPHSEVEHQWPSWTAFFEGTNKRFNGKEICDCYRIACCFAVMENRYYYDEENRLRVTYIQLYKHGWGTSGHSLKWLGDPYEGRLRSSSASLPSNVTYKQTGCRPGGCNTTFYQPHWRHNVIETLEGHVASLEPDVVVFNTGLWEQLPSELDVTRLIAAGHKAVSAKNGTFFFRSTTTSRDGVCKDDRKFSATVEAGGWNILEAGRYTTALPSLHKTYKDGIYWDNYHYYPSVYAALNQVMLNMICPVAAREDVNASAYDQCPGNWSGQSSYSFNDYYHISQDKHRRGLR